MEGLVGDSKWSSLGDGNNPSSLVFFFLKCFKKLFDSFADCGTSSWVDGRWLSMPMRRPSRPSIATVEPYVAVLEATESVLALALCAKVALCGEAESLAELKLGR